MRKNRIGREGTAMLFPTTLVGSYPQPDWLIDRKRLAGRFPPREVAFGKLQAMVAGAKMVRAQLGASS
jgi:methionine synthase II (cobalamin-independent)